MRLILRSTIIACIALAAALPAAAQLPITTPRQQLGHGLGDDYFLANYRQLADYWRKIDAESDRVKLEQIGTTSEGRPMLMAIITSPENHARLGRFQEIARRLAHAEGLTDAEARALADEGKAVVWVDGGLHASEVLGAQQLMELVYELASGTDAETSRFLRDVIVLAVHANPDGHDLVADWYMRRGDTLQRSTRGVPRLYHKYVGHDNNRDSFLASQLETRAMDSVMFRAWYPQIMYNHHQTSPDGTIMFAPPFRDPFNYNLDPLVVTMLDQVGSAMHSRMIAEGKPGTVMRGGANFSTWWNGGLRTTVYFHNMVGLLTETFGHPTPAWIELRPNRLLPSGSLPFPVTPQLWRFRQSMDYERTANRAVLDFASRHREELLYNIYRMGRNSIERGSRDHWTSTPDRVAELARTVGGDTVRQTPDDVARYLSSFRRPEDRDPRGYILSASQPDFATATKFVNTLIKLGVTVHRATAPFTVADKSYPAGSFVVLAAQAFRPHVRDMFEPQNHPNDIPFPGGTPTPPYDAAGWTLAYQMGVTFDRVLDGFTGPFERITGFATVPQGRVGEMAGAPGWFIGHETNDAFVAVNRLLAAGQDVFWLRDSVRTGSSSFGQGAYYVPVVAAALPLLRQVAREKGLTVVAAQRAPAAAAMVKLRPVRIALWDAYGGSMPSGWTRWLLEQFEFPFTVVYPPDLDAPNLKARFDVLILPDGAEAIDPASRNAQRIVAATTAPDDAPAEWRARGGVMTETVTVPRLREFLEQGGRILAIGSATDLASSLGLPVASALTDSTGRELRRAQYYIPGSLLRARVDNTHPLAHGMPRYADMFFDNSPSFRLGSDAGQRGLRRVAWFDSATPLSSGWAWGQRYLENSAAVVEAQVGQGTLVLFGPEVLFRAQPHGTFKLLFNGILYGGAQAWR
ncbi:MAG TPA: M14 metallopeptidase family protein [Gemmatimonadaceae bacterium]|nr:M14 metallopeptidase family protein [Gemmatimonadaceae bacterium]